MRLRSALWRASRWDTQHLTRYEKMITRQSRRGERREDPNLVACPHRLQFAWTGDEDLRLDADHIAMECAGESLSDWAGLARTAELVAAHGRTGRPRLSR